MAGADQSEKKYALVTGANKGIGFEICKQLLSRGVTVIMTARDEKRGLDSLAKLIKETGSSDSSAFFLSLDVTDSETLTSVAHFLKFRFGKLDILVNNAGISGAIVDVDAFQAAVAASKNPSDIEPAKLKAMMTETPDSATEAFQTNYYGATRTVEALLPLLHSSPSPRIVNIFSAMGKLKNIRNEWARGILGDHAENLTEEKIDQVVAEFLKDLKDECLEVKGWPHFLSAYSVSKAAMNAYTRILARRYPSFRVNCVCPGYVATDINFHTGVYSVEEGALGPVRLCLLADGGPTGSFFLQKEVTSFEE